MDGGEVASAPDGPTSRPLVADELELTVPEGGRVVIMSDLHLMSRASTTSTEATDALAEALEGWDGPGVVVLAGDCWELLAEPHRDPGLALDAHPRFAEALARWSSAAERHVVILPGNHDGALAWDPRSVATVGARLGAQVALRVRLRTPSATGPRVILVEHGHQLDPANAFLDPRDPSETPLGHHVVQDVLPALEGITRRGWAAGLELIADPGDVPAFVGSRLAYRRIGPLLGAVAAPLLLGAVLALLAGGVGGPDALGVAAGVLLAVGVVLAIAVVGGALVWGGLVWSAARGVRADFTGGGGVGNDAARDRAEALRAEGVDLYVTGHTHEPELVELDGVVYGNPGCGGGLLHRRPGRVGLPDVFTVVRHVSWLEVDVGPALEARLWVGHRELPVLGAVERWASRPAAPAPPEPTRVASVRLTSLAPVPTSAT